MERWCSRLTSDFKCTPEENSRCLAALERKSWQALSSIIREQTANATLCVRLRSFFEDRFRYDESGVPRVWKPSDDIDAVFVKARDAVCRAACSKTNRQSLELIPLYARVQPADAELKAHVKNTLSDAFADAAAEDEEPIEPDTMWNVLSEMRCTEIADRLRKDADALFVEAKRSTVSSMSQVPIWMYALVVVLGWNEFVAVLRSPVYFTMLLLLLTGAYFVWRMNMSGPLLTVSSAMAREVQKVVEDQLRNYLAPQSAMYEQPVPAHAPTALAAKPPGGVKDSNEAFEMDNLAPRSDKAL